MVVSLKEELAGLAIELGTLAISVHAEACKADMAVEHLEIFVAAAAAEAVVAAETVGRFAAELAVPVGTSQVVETWALLPGVR